VRDRFPLVPPKFNLDTFGPVPAHRTLTSLLWVLPTTSQRGDIRTAFGWRNLTVSVTAYQSGLLPLSKQDTLPSFDTPT
jgi:hypothetical protein